MDSKKRKASAVVHPDALDQFDLQILQVLQMDNRTSQRTIGDQVHLSAPAVQRRIRKLEDAGVITANVAVVHPASVGRAITILVEVKMESERIDLLDAAKASFAGATEVQQCYYVTGDADFVLVITVATMEAYEALTRRLFFDNGNVQRFRTLVVMDRVKVTLNVPIDSP
jgi:Lrp/AsnC family leucine-responsive transcriptional regulator